MPVRLATNISQVFDITVEVILLIPIAPLCVKIELLFFVFKTEVLRKRMNANKLRSHTVPDTSP